MRARPRSSAPSLPRFVPFALGAALLAAGATSCASSDRALSAQAADVTGESGGSSDDAEEELQEAQDAVDDARRDLAYAEYELEAAGMKAEAKSIERQEEERSVRAALGRAQAELEAFRDIEMAIEQDDAALEVQDAEDGLLTAQTDLEGLEEIFAEEAEASAKPEILRRGRRRVARAEARLSMQQRRSELTVDHELPARLAKLGDAAESAEAKVAALQFEAGVASIEARLQRLKAEDAVAKARRALERAERKLAKLGGEKEADE